MRWIDALFARASFEPATRGIQLMGSRDPPCSHQDQHHDQSLGEKDLPKDLTG